MAWLVRDEIGSGRLGGQRHKRGQRHKDSSLFVTPVVSPLHLADGPAIAALEAVQVDVDAAEALGAAPPLLPRGAVGPPLARLPLLAAHDGGVGVADQGRPGPPAQVLLVVLAVVVPAVVQAVEVFGRAQAPPVVARVRLLGRRLPVHVLVVPLQVRLALERLRAAARLEAVVAIPRSWSGEVVGAAAGGR